MNRFITARGLTDAYRAKLDQMYGGNLPLIARLLLTLCSVVAFIQVVILGRDASGTEKALRNE